MQEAQLWVIKLPN